jgi:hypothetical protein
VGVEKLGFSEKSRKSGNRKCPGEVEKSFVELPDAKQFLRNRGERVFQQPPLFSTVIWKVRPAIEPMSTPVPSGYSGFAERTSDLRTISHRPPTMPL